MKTIYSFVFALFWTFAATAQTPVSFINENFSSKPYTVAYEGAWEVISSDPGPGSGGNYLAVVANSSKFRSVFATFNAADFQGLEVSWYERTTAGSVTRALTCYVGSAGDPVSLITTSTVVSSTWTQHTVSLPKEADNYSYVRLRWDIVRASTGSSDKYAIDDIVVSGEYEPIPVAPLPVELAAFSGQTLVGAIKLDWTTASEKNNDKFIVERSQDGKNFTKAGEVKGSGNSAIKRSYSFTDNVPSGGIHYYRLRQVDFDGTESFSKVVALKIAGGAAGLTATVYPTVASSSVTISLQHVNNAAISVTDASGRVMATFNNTTEREITLPVNNFKSGLYFVRVTDGQNHQVQRFIKK